MDFGRTLKALRLDKKETLHQTAMGTNIDMTLLSKFERGERLPTPEQTRRLAMYFDTDATRLAAEVTANKIIGEYGYSDATFEALSMVMESFAEYRADFIEGRNG
ncbi:MAG: helix-turn-helix domain-containing protein [Spirochaetaceae bacterium]|jgi:transcriptional regulator with XRE-family HTH domain|nr:helix-turn-helix domain-containing protein [Spirochaetaceae bacterium]